jgi:hypothetical protein
MLNQTQKDLILVKILSEPKVPDFLKKGLGRILFPALINEVDVLLSGTLPKQIQELINSAADGLDADEIALLSQELLTYVLEKIKNPVLKSVLPIVLPLILTNIVNALARGQKL